VVGKLENYLAKVIRDYAQFDGTYTTDDLWECLGHVPKLVELLKVASKHLECHGCQRKLGELARDAMEKRGG
jgi:hypothetical protein